MTSAGRLLAFGENCHGQLGAGILYAKSIADNPTPTIEPSPVESVWDGLFMDISGGGAYTLVLDCDGGVWLVGSLYCEEAVPMFAKVDGLPPIAQIACGYSHAMAVDRQGCVWVIPNSTNELGQLGLGHRDSCSAVQQAVAFPPVLRVSCGSTTTVVEALGGGLWACGSNIF